MFLHTWLQNVRLTLARRPAQRNHRRLCSFRTATHWLSVEALEDRRLLSTFTVLNLADSGEGSLRAAIQAAEINTGPDVIDFASTALGTIALTSGQLSITDDLTIDGPGIAQLSISGSNHSRIFRVSGGATVAIDGLTITDGMAVGDGGGILNTGGTLTLTQVVLSNNQAVGAPGGNGRGGAIANMSGATLAVSDSLFTQNKALGGAGGGQGNGAGILNFGSRLTVSHTAFISNQAIGAGGGGNARGGGIDNTNVSTATVTDSTFVGNQATAGDGGGGQGFGRGGGIYNFRSTLAVENSIFEDNLARGGSNITRGNRGGVGGIIIAIGAGAGVFNADGGFLSVTGSHFKGNQARGGSGGTSLGGSGHFGTAFGAGLHNSEVATVTDSVFAHNETRGGSNNKGDGTSFQFIGTALGGAISNMENLIGTAVHLTLDNVTLSHNQAVGGDGNSAGTFVGAGIGGALMGYGINALAPTSGGGTITLRDSTISHNKAVGGSREAALGGGVANLLGGVLNVSGSTLTNNRAQGGDGETVGDGGGGFGGGFYNGAASTHPSNLDAPTILTVERSTIRKNHANGGDGGRGASDGEGIGGGVYNLGGFDMDVLDLIYQNHASTSHDDIFDFLA